MATLALTTVGAWVGNLGTGRVARWGDAIVHYRRLAGFPDFSTRIEDTGAAGAFSAFTISNSTATAALYARAGQGDDTYMYLCQEDQVDLFRLDTAGTLVDLGNRTGSGGLWNSVHGGHPSLIVATHSQTSGSRITTYPKPTGGAATDIVTSAAASMFETLEVDPATGLIYVSTFFAGSSRGVRRYQDDGTLDWSATIPNAVADSIKTVNGIAKVSAGVVAYTVDVDEPGGIRVNNNWWLIDDSGNVELLDVTVDGIDFATWADTGSNEISLNIGSLSVLDDVIYVPANTGDVLGGTFVTPGGSRWGSVGWAS